MSEILKAIAGAKKRISPPKRTGKAMYGRYANLEAVLDSVEPPLMEEGVIITHKIGISEYGPYVRTSLVHLESGEGLDSDFPLVAKNQNDPQQIGGAITYGRRYSLSAMLSIVSEDDDDGNTSAGKNKDGSPKKDAPAKSKGKGRGVTQQEIEETFQGGERTQEEVDKLFSGYQRCGFEEMEVVPEIRALLGNEIKQISELTEAQMKSAMAHARKVKAGKAQRLT